MCSISEIVFCTLTYQLVSGLFLWFISLYQMTPLHLAAERGRYKTIIVYLVDQGADVDIKDDNKVHTDSSCFELLMRKDTA